MKTCRVLILEDDLATLSKLMEALRTLEDECNVEIATTVLSEYSQVEDYVNRTESITWDIVLLDRDCKAGGSFHTINLEKIGTDKVIGISSMPAYNQQLRDRGITKVVNKDYEKLDDFVRSVGMLMRAML